MISAGAQGKRGAEVNKSVAGKLRAGCGNNGGVCFRDAGAGYLIADHSERKSKLDAVDFTPDVQFIASAGNDGRIIIWDVQTRQTVKDIEAHADGVTDIVFGNKGTMLVSVGNDGNIKIWDVSDLNIGKKKFTIGTRKPKLACSQLELYDKNGNG